MISVSFALFTAFVIIVVIVPFVDIIYNLIIFTFYLLDAPDAAKVIVIIYFAC